MCLMEEHANSWTDMVLIYSETSGILGPEGGFKPILWGNGDSSQAMAYR